MRKMWMLVLAVALVQGVAAAQAASTQTQGSAAGNAQVGNAQASGTASTQAASSMKGGHAQASGSSSTQASGAAEGKHAQAGLASGSAIHAELTKPLDARKAKPGDAVEAKVTQDVRSNGQVVIKHGTRLVGHVTQAQARANGASSTALGIAFDQAEPKGGPAIPVHAVIQAVAAAQSNLAASGDEEMMPTPAMGSMGSPAPARSGGGGLVPAVGSTVGAAGNGAGNVGGLAGNTLGSTANAAGSVAGNVAGDAAHVATNASGGLTGTAQGVTGLPGVVLNSAASSATSGSVMTSGGKDLHLDSGTQLLLRVTGE